jgi:hypothetical protein
LSALLAAVVAAPQAQRPGAPRVTSPLEQFGKNIGDDYFLVNWTQWVEYLQKMDRESDRMSVIEIGKTAEGRTQYTAIVTSPDNHRRLAQYKDMNRRLALVEGVTDEQARQLARDGKVVVWIDGGLHANEVLGAAQLIELTYRLNSATDPETMRILNDEIVLLTNINPDGMELVSNWYMRQADERRRSTAGVPRLYQKYIGHDNNRDFYMMSQPESENANRIMYREWFPAIMYNHHQTGPAGAVLFAPPFRDPFNYHFDPLIPLGIDIVGAAMHTRLAAEGKPGAVMRSAASYSTWFNGGIRTTSYFHNQIGILTEMIGSPTPSAIPFVPDMQLRRTDVPNPIAPQPWRFRQSIEYSMTTNYAILDIASKRKEDFLFNMYTMAKNAIDAGSRDHWTLYPRRIDAVKGAIAKETGGTGRGTAPASLYNTVLRDPAMRDPRGFILPSDQPDFLTATKFVNILIKAGVVVHRAAEPFAANGRTYPSGSYVVKTAQPFRAHVMDMFEPQDHPNDFPYPGGPPRAPYDATGYNPSYSMGIAFDRVLEPFDGRFERLADAIAPPPGRVAQAPKGGAYVISGAVNDAFVAVNRLLKANQPVVRATTPIDMGRRSFPAGSILVPATPASTAILEKVAAEKGLTVESFLRAPTPTAPAPLRPVRIGLWDMYGGSMPSGWTRWLLEQFEFPFEVVFPKTLDAGDLASRYDVLIFVDGAIPMRDVGGTGQPATDSIPAEFRDWLGTVTVSRTVPELRKFVEAGGRILAIGSSTSLGYHFGLPIRNALVDGDDGGTLPAEKFYIPGSLLEARVDASHPLAFGIADPVNIFFDDSPAFRLLPDAAARGVKSVAWFGSASPLKSGWAWGQQYLDQAVQIVDAPVGKGRVLLFAPEIAWRGQPHGTFKFLFNGIYYSAEGQ